MGFQGYRRKIWAGGGRLKEEIARFRKFFELPYSPVGIKILKERRDDAELKPARYCELVRRSAVFGEEFILTAEKLTCAGAEVALGFSEPMFDENGPRIETGTESIMIKPLEKMEEEPDVVIIISTPKKLMKISGVYSKVFNEPVKSEFRGSSAICGECTAIPLIEDRANLSLLCDGCRTFSGYKPDEVAIGMPYRVFIELMKGIKEDRIIKALCGCIMDDLPKNAVKTITEMGFDKATDHFMGYAGKHIIRMYAIKNEKGRIEEITLYLPLKFKDEDEAERIFDRAEEFFSEPYMIRLRENWLDIILPVELFAPLQRVVQDREKFENIINSAIDTLTTKVEEFRKKYGS